jgi:UDPglucose 6-dehydrogenase
VKALARTARGEGAPMSVLEAVDQANERQKRRLCEKLQQALNGKLKGARVAVWGLSYKPQTDDMRESPALSLIDQLLEEGADVVAHDPVAMNEAKRRFGDSIAFAENSYAAVAGADALAIVTEWNEYRHPDLKRVKEALRRPIVVDGRNLYDPARMRQLGFTYLSIGRNDVCAS